MTTKQPDSVERSLIVPAGYRAAPLADTKAAAPERLDPGTPYILRKPFTPLAPFGISADGWRNVVGRAPIVSVCKRTLILQITATPWKVVGDDEDEVKYYTDVIEGANDESWDLFVERILDDVMTVPFGGACEPTRYRGGELSSFFHVDGATLWPTYDSRFPYLQIDPDNPMRKVPFAKDTILRLMWAPIPDIRNYGWSKTPVMDVFPAVEALLRSDVFYGQFLSNTPEAGILDLMDMDEAAARKWVVSWQELMIGIDPLKVPVLYGHDKEARFLQFSRSPAELALGDITKRYAEQVTAAFGMSIGDLGLFEHMNTLAGASRMMQAGKRQGLGSLMRKVANLVNTILPPEVRFEWAPLDEEDRLKRAQANKARADTLAVLARGDQVTGVSIFPVEIIRKQAVLDGLIDVLKIDEVDLVNLGIEPAGTQDESKVPAQNEIPEGEAGSEAPPPEQVKSLALTSVQDAAVERVDMTEYPEDAPYAKRFEQVIAAAFGAARLRIRRAPVKRIVDRVIPLVERSAASPLEVERALGGDIEDLISSALDEAGYYSLSPDRDALIAEFKAAYESGLYAGARDISRGVRALGRVPPPIAEADFNLENPLAVKALNERALGLVKQLEEGTRYFMLNAFRHAFNELGPGSANELVTAIYENLTSEEQGAFSKSRVESIVRTEMNYIHSNARLEQYRAAGLTRKVWRAVLSVACPICVHNNSLGPRPLDYEYQTVFGTSTHPPAHPVRCHCHLSLDEAELDEIATEDISFWDGSES